VGGLMVSSQFPMANTLSLLLLELRYH